MRFCDIDGIVHHYRDEGPRRAHAVVFINSLGTDLRVWDAVAPSFTNTHRVIRYDKRGHGLSGLGPASATMADFARDLAGLLDHVGVERATIVGLSIGGLIAQAFYAAAPQRVTSFVFADTAHRIGTAESWAARLDAVAKGGVAAVADAVLERWFTPRFHQAHAADLAGWRTMLVRTPAEGYVAACTALRDADYTETARAIPLPTLCLVGDQDGSTPPDLVRSLADLIEGARFEVIREAGHIPCVEQPAATTALIRAHLEDLGHG